MTNSDTLQKTSSLYNVQPTSHTFPSLPNFPESPKFINKFNFQFSDLTNTEYVTLCKLLLKYKICYATHENDVGKIATPFRNRLKSNFLHNDLLKYQSITVINSTIFLKN